MRLESKLRALLDKRNLDDGEWFDGEWEYFSRLDKYFIWT